MDNRFIFTDGDFTFTGTDGRTYGWDSNGTPTPVQPINLTVPNTGGSYGNSTTSNHSGVGVSTTSANDFAADRWTNIASRPFSPISTGPSQPLIQNNLTPSLSNTTSTFQPSFQPIPNLSLPQPNIPSLNSNGSVLSQSVFENDFDNTGVMNYSGSAMPENIIQLAHLINVRGTMPNGWGPNVLINLKVLNLSGNSLSGPELSQLFKSMYYQKMDLNLLDLSHNKMCDNSVGEMLWSIGNESGKQIHAIRCLKLNNNQFSDKSAEYFNLHLSSGSLKYTKEINISGNNITQDGDTKIVQALKGVWQDIVVFTHTLDEIVKMDEGTKEEKIAIYKAIVEKGKALGTYDKAMVVDKSWFGKISHVKNEGILKLKWLFGFGKCHVVPDPKEEVTSYAQDQIIATLPSKTASGLGIAKKGSGVLTKHYDFVTCFISSTDEVWSSELGQQIAKHELCLLGQNDFCGGE